MARLQFHYFPNSHWSRVVALLIAEKDLQPERRFVDIRVNATFEPDYIRLNPKGVVPTLVDGDQVICNSPRIAEHLDSLGGAPLVRRDDPVHARWCDTLEDFRLMHLSYSVWVLGRKGERSAQILADKVDRARRYASEHPALAEAYTRKGDFFDVFRRELLDPDAMARIIDESRAVIETMGTVVDERPWLGGDAYGFADAIATSILYRLVDLELIHEWHADPEHPVRRYYDRLVARPSFAAVFRDDPLIP